MVERVPQLRNEVVRELDTVFRAIGKLGHELDSALHDHGLIVTDPVTLELCLDHLKQSFHICTVSDKFTILELGTHTAA